MKLITIVVFIIMLVSCNQGPSGHEYVGLNENPMYNYRIVNIDSCQYIEVDVGVGSNSTYSLTHKGDCKNTIHYKQR